MSERARNGLQRWRVPLGFLAVTIYLALAQPTWRLIGFGLPLAFAGLIIRGWASGHLRKNTRLAVSGPYAFTRNPLYLGSMLMLAGGLVAGGNPWLAAGLLSLFLLVYYPVMQSEARQMRILFGTEYDRWAASVPLLLPKLSPWQAMVQESFEWSLYLQHREYRALIGLAVLYATLGLKVAFS